MTMHHISVGRLSVHFAGEVFLLAALSLAASVEARAQAWPSRPVTIVVPNPAGGPPDVLARVIAHELSDKLGRPFVIENRGGGGGNIGSASVAKAPPDGYTLLLTTTGPAAINRLIYTNMQYDPDRDLAPIGLLTKSPLVIVAGLHTPFKTVGELLAAAKLNAGKLNVGIPGNGTIGHLTSALLQMTAGVTMTHVPYRGAAPLTNDLLAGQIDISFGFVTGYLPLLTAGKIRALGVTGNHRSSKLADVPTLHESGFPGFEATAWYGMFAPAQAPPEIIEKINQTINAYMVNERGRQQLDDLDMQAIGGRPEHLTNFIRDEVAKWGPVIKALGITM